MKIKSKIRTAPYLLVVIITTLLQGCASVVLRPVAESEKDTTGSFDGTWSGVVLKTALKQRAPGWRLNCSDQTGKKYGPLRVRDGKLSASIYGQSGTTFVSPTGKFKLDLPLNNEATGTNGSIIGNAKTTLMLSGSLDSQAGIAMFHIAELNTGCQSPVTFSKN